MSWFLGHLPLVADSLLAHLSQVLPAVATALAISVPAARLAQRVGVLRTVLVSGSSLLYAVPSLALFVVLPVVLGTGMRDPVNVVVALTLYGVALLLPVTVDALEAVDRKVLDAAAAMGVGTARCFWTVELPLAGPALLAGLRVVTVSTVSLTTVGAVLGVKSIGSLFTDGLRRGLLAEVVTGIVLTVVLAVALDALVVLAGRLLMPWTRRGPKQVKATTADKEEL